MEAKSTEQLRAWRTKALEELKLPILRDWERELLGLLLRDLDAELASRKSCA